MLLRAFPLVALAIPAPFRVGSMDQQVPQSLMKVCSKVRTLFPGLPETLLFPENPVALKLRECSC